MTTDEAIWESLAARNGCQFMGLKRFGDGKLYDQYTDLKTGSSFTRKPGETIGMAAEKVRAKFGRKI
jgi:hypothetical protein